MKIVVMGGSGRVGGNVVRRLVAQGHEAASASPDTALGTSTDSPVAGWGSRWAPPGRSATALRYRSICRAPA
jgi:hypothetical protein